MSLSARLGPGDIVDELTRRRLLGAGLGAVSLAGLAACGNDSRTATAPKSLAAPTTRQVEADNGTVTAPSQAKRVVALDTWTLNSCLDVGAHLVGTTEGAAAFVPPQFRARAKAVPVVAASGTPDLEKIAAAQPDLIMTIFLDKKVLPKLSAIAPVVAHQNTDFASTESYFATALGRPDQLAAAKRSYGNRIADIRSSYRKQLVELKWSIVSALSTSNAYVYHQLSTGGKVLVDLGAHWSSADVPGKDPVDDGTVVSFENLDRLADADIILNNSSGVAGTQQALTADPVVRSLPATKAGHLYATTVAYPQSYGQAAQMLDLVERILQQFA
ncbi:iron(3+)-hydroxamate-binding protein FhuD [Microlunatus endophyticus]|uniref:Iron(3+)-hydroxamate-binding protein FhuD n=1 Tax=Microlunatus endophyticus TaxID=1716077 RepID=A0A917S3T4_9ACTN|nr:ABC transporter substrate-binding protein [Microlunatus endophyticus]GGL56081.1 iron(3+)-hydroxamate-binding protein FhuD [Microlunatus endophyticus]